MFLIQFNFSRTQYIKNTIIKFYYYQFFFDSTFESFINFFQNFTFFKNQQLLKKKIRDFVLIINYFKKKIRSYSCFFEKHFLFFTIIVNF